MKKMSLLALALVVVLPGCRDKKKETTQTVRKSTVKTYAQTPDDDEIIEVTSSSDDDNDDNDDNDDDDVLEDIDFSDLDLKEINFEDMSDEELDRYLTGLEDEAEEAEDMSNDDQAFNWVDAQLDDEFKKLYFSFNHYGIREDQKQALAYDIEQVKQLLADTQEDKPTVIIEGHACQEGTPAYNLALSEKRAKNVADLFVAQGIDKAAIKVVGRGQECPTVKNGKVVNGSREDRAPNRRVEVRVIYT